MKGFTKVAKVAVLAAASAVMAAGCADSNVASKQNLTDALNHDYLASHDCLFSKPMPFPYEVAMNDKLLTETRRRLDALANAGLLGAGADHPEWGYGEPLRVNRCGQQDRGCGQVLLRTPPGNQRGEFQPRRSNYNGKPLTKVEYHFVMKDSPSWAKKDEVINAFPDVAKSMAPQPVDDATLILTHDGWVLTY